MPGKKDFSKFVGLASEQADRDMVYKDLQARGKDTNNRMFDKGSKIKQVNPGKIKQLKLFKAGGNVDPLKGLAKMITNIEKGKTGIKTVDMQKRKDAALTKNLKKLAKRTKVRAKPQTLDITPKPGGAFSIQKRSIMMASEGGVVNMTKSRMVNPETGE